MSNDNKSGWTQPPAEDADENAAHAQEQAAQQPPAAGEAQQADTEPPAEDDELARLRAENAELKDKYLRALADMENLRRRLLREKEEAVKHASADLARDMLTVCDNLGRAIESVPPERRNEHELLASLLEGVEMTLKSMLDAFERHHIRRIPAHGERFDPNVHEAMFEVPTSEAEAGTVVQVVQEGYTHHDRVLRPARVGVASTANTEGGDAGNG